MSSVPLGKNRRGRRKKMKKKLVPILVMTLMIATAALPVVGGINFGKDKNIDESMTIMFEANSYKISKEDDGYHLLDMEDFTCTDSPGDPSLPHKTFNILVHPDIDWSTLQLDITSSQITSLPGLYNIKPAGPVCTWDGEQVITIFGEGKDIVDCKNMNVYGNDENYPENCVSLIDKSQMRKWKFVKVDFIPLQYNPVSQELFLMEDVTVELSYTRSDEGLPDKFAEDHVMDDVASQIFFNYDEGKYWYGGDDFCGSSSPGSGYVIITTNAIESGSNKLDDFVNYKQDLGHDVLVITENEYGGLTLDGTAEKIREWLKNNYISEGIEYVLLIGDPNPDDPDWDNIIGDVPMKTCYPNASNGEGYPTDYFYAGLDGSWNADGDQYFGEWWEYGGDDDVDLDADVYVGRIPVYSTNYNDLDNILQKIIDYDTEIGDISWRKNVLLPMGFQNDWYDGAALSEQMIYDYLNPNGYLDWTMYQQGSVDPAYDSIYDSDEELRGNEYDPPEPTTQECVKDRWSGLASPTTPNDFGIVVWWAHGHDTHAYVYWDGTLLASGDCSSLDDDHPSWTYQCSCGNGHPEASNNLGYAILKNGGIGTVSSSRNSFFWTGDSYGDFDNSRGTSANLGYEYIMRLAAQELPAGKALYLAKYSLNPWIHTLYSFNLYGDPGLSITPSLLPQVVIESPEDESIFDVPDITISGYMTDYGGGITGVKILHEYTGDESTIYYPFPTPPEEFLFDWDWTLYLGWNRITITAYDTAGQEGSDSITVYYDITPPTVETIKPKKGYLYIADREIMLTPITLVVGKITIEAEAFDNESGIDKVEFYVDDELKNTDHEAPYEWLWDETIFFRHTIKAVAYNNFGNTASDEQVVWIFNI